MINLKTTIASEHGQGNQWTNELYATAELAQLQCALDWITACGDNSSEDVAEFLKSTTDAEVLDDLLSSGWSFPKGTSKRDGLDAIAVARVQMSTRHYITADTVKAAWGRRGRCYYEGSVWWIVGVSKIGGIRVEAQMIPIGRWPFAPSVQIGPDLSGYAECFDDPFEQIALELVERYLR